MSTDTLANALERWLKNYDPEDFGCACMPEATCSTCRWRERIKPLQDALAAHRSEPPQPWVPYLSDRADGVPGHYAIARWNPRGFREVWNLRKHCWAAFSDDVLSLEEADSLLRQIAIPTVRAAA